MNNTAQQYLIRSEMEGNFNPIHYAELLKNDIRNELTYELWKFREHKSGTLSSVYGACVHMMDLVDKTVKNF